MTTANSTEATDEVLAAFVEDVEAEGPVAVAGARTRWDVGGALDDGARVLAAPVGIVAHEPDEMTVRVRAGTTVADLHQALAAEGQRTALPDRGGTVGGALAVGEDHLAVLGVERVRTAPLQVRYVSADGRLVTGGGPTVKNVSGYDLPRLFVGSLGTFGLLAEVLLRTNPIPAASAWLAADGVDPFVVCDALYRPSAVLAAGDRTWVLLEGHEPDVEYQRGVLADHGDFGEVAGPPDLPRHRWSLRRSDLRSRDRDVDADALIDRWGDHVMSVGTGTVFASTPQPRPTPDEALAALAARVKHEFDPTGRLNPGRHPHP